MQQNKNGFTIVELIIVIIVIGILAAVTIVGYGAWRTNIATSNVKSDLTGISSAMDGARNFSNTYPTSIPSSFSASPDVTATYMYGDGQSYCINAVSKKVPSVAYYLKTGTISQGSCPDQHYDVIATNAGAAKTTCSSGSCTGRIVKLTLDPAGTSWSGTYYASDSNYYYVSAHLSYSLMDTNNNSYNDSTTVTFTPDPASGVMVSTRYTADTYPGILRISVNPAAADGTNTYGGTFQSSVSIILDQYNGNSSVGSSATIWLRIPKSNAPAIITIPVSVDSSNMPNTSMDAGYISGMSLKKT